MNKYRISCFKHIGLLAMALLAGLGLFAQEVQVPESEISVYLKAPISHMSFDVGNYGEQNNGFGAGIGAQYAHYFNFNWSVSAGLEFQTYRSEAMFNAFSDSYSTTDMEGDNFEYRYSVDSYHEREYLSLLNIPIKVQYERGINETLTFFGSGGFAIGFPVSAKYKSQVYNLKTAGYYPQWDALLTSPKFMGFGSWGNRNTGKIDMDTKTSFTFLLEAGLKYKLTAGTNFYMGLFADIPLNKLNKTDGGPDPLVEYNTSQPTTLIFNPAINSAPGAEGTPFADKLKVVAWGVKLRYAFDF
ncbi:outer membrane beta-barrel protein [Mangrovibacterium diazotrophicum]|nr:outer membrane beta-barrel protein [Mangrovibacterium diazotrophicum]